MAKCKRCCGRGRVVKVDAAKLTPRLDQYARTWIQCPACNGAGCDCQQFAPFKELRLIMPRNQS